MKMCKAMMEWSKANSEYEVAIHEKLHHPEIKDMKIELNNTFKRMKNARERLLRMV
jgi:hypothetical protein